MILILRHYQPLSRDDDIGTRNNIISCLMMMIIWLAELHQMLFLLILDLKWIYQSHFVWL